MTSERRNSERRNFADHQLDDLAALAVDALDDGERLAIEATLLGDDQATDLTSVFQAAATAYVTAVGRLGEVEPPAAGMRSRVLGQAFERRAPVAVAAADARDAHLVETERLELLARRLTPEQWNRPVDPPEFDGWSIRDLVAHLASNEALLAQTLGVPIDVPETELDNEARTAQVIDRHRSLPADAAVAEFRAARLAADEAARSRSDDELQSEVEWWGTPLRVRDVLVLRAFETWTHADDIRRAIDVAGSPPAAPVLKQMSSSATDFMPWSMASTGKDYTGKSILIDLTGPGGGAYHLDLGFDGRSMTGVAPDAVLRIDPVAFCHGVGRRSYLYDGGRLPFEAEGDAALVDDLLATIDALAVL